MRLEVHPSTVDRIAQRNSLNEVGHQPFTVRDDMPTEFDAAIPDAQRAIRARCVHPTGRFTPFPTAALETSIARRFEAQAARHPGRLALKTRRHALTYAELDAVANRIARAIAAHPGTAGDPIALLFDPGPLVIAAMLAALKAGRPYVPLDPSYPLARLDYIVRDATASLVLTEPTHAALAQTLAGEAAQIVDVESLDEAPAGPCPDAPGPQAPALVIYTSGSTGQPKGVVHNHRNVLRDVMHYTNSGHFCAEDRFLLLSSISFADSIRTIYSSLLNGAALFPFDLRGEGLSALAAWMVEQRITIYRSIPTVFRYFVRSLAGDETWPDLRLIYLGGEPVRRTDADLYRRHFPRTCVLVNRLGTTETLTFSCFFLDHDTPVTGGTVPVGYAVSGHDVRIVDDHATPLPPGTEGQIAIRSRYLSPGFWGRPDASRTAFAADPLDDEMRVYKPGDLGVMSADGCLEHTGRRDVQVKIRGHRIELQEVEAALVGLDGIGDAAVVVDHRDTQDRLVAYIVPDGAVAPQPRAIGQLLAARLPEYMLPAGYVVVSALPTLANGKLDRRALSPSLETRPAPTVPIAPPRDPVEREIAQAWAEVLELDRFGIHDDFLDLGGDSLLLIRIVARVQARFGGGQWVEALWYATTVAGMADVVAQHVRAVSGAGAAVTDAPLDG